MTSSVDLRRTKERFLSKARVQVQEAFMSRDMLLGHVSKTLVDLDKIIHQMSERLEEWYAIYFPELKHEDPIKFARLVLAIDRENISKEKLMQLVSDKKADEIVAKNASSIGAKIKEGDRVKIQELAQSIIELDSLRVRFGKYQEELAQDICPNMTHLVGADVAARLVARIGNLKRLAVLPASTLQVIGAEKALFLHLKSKRKIAPPKHGIIFQFSKISSAPRSVRGKISRLISNKLAIASKADYFTKNFIAPDLKKNFEEHYSKIMAGWEKNKNSPVQRAKDQEPERDNREGFQRRPPMRDNRPGKKPFFNKRR